MNLPDFAGCSLRIDLEQLLKYDNLAKAAARAVRKATAESLAGAVVHVHIGEDVDLTALENDDAVDLFILQGMVGLHLSGHGTQVHNVAVATTVVRPDNERTLKRMDVYFIRINR